MTPKKERESLSERLYARFVRFYPQAFREEFGDEMKRVFQEQLSDARKRGWSSVVSLWMRTLADAAKTVVKEHMEASKEVMRNGALYYCHQRFTFRRMFLGTSLSLVAFCVLVTFLLPKVYMSMARLELKAPDAGAYNPDNMQRAFERVKSQKVLLPVIEELNLTEVLPEQLGIGQSIKAAEAYQLLLPMLQLRQSRNTSLLEIRVFSENPDLAAAIANKIAESSKRSVGGLLVDSAQPEKRPVRPNVPLNLTLGAVVSVVFGLMAAATGRLALWAIFRRA